MLVALAVALVVVAQVALVAVAQVELAVVAILLEVLEYQEMVLIVVEFVDSELVVELEQLVEEDLTSSSQHQRIQTHSE